jgi:hypothetical protein
VFYKNIAFEVKQFITILLIVLIGFQTFYPVTIYAYYYGNKNYIVTALCENKNKPKLQCNGKCFIKKQLKKVEQEQQKEKPQIKETALSAFFIAVDSYSHQPKILGIATKDTLPHSNSYSYLFVSTHFRPPGVL